MPTKPPIRNRTPRPARAGTRSGRRPRRIPTLWVRLAVLSLFVVALIVGMVGLALKADRPYREAGAQSARLALTRRQAAALQAQDDALRQHIAYLKTPEGIAEEAHRLGYMRPGERPLVILGLAAPDAASGPAPFGASSGDSPLLTRFQRHLRDL